MEKTYLRAHVFQFCTTIITSAKKSLLFILLPIYYLRNSRLTPRVGARVHTHNYIYNMYLYWQANRLDRFSWLLVERRFLMKGLDGLLSGIEIAYRRWL